MVGLKLIHVSKRGPGVGSMCLKMNMHGFANYMYLKILKKKKILAYERYDLKDIFQYTIFNLLIKYCTIYDTTARQNTYKEIFVDFLQNFHDLF